MLKLVCPVPVPRISCCHFHNCSPDTGAQSGLRTKLHQAVPLPRQLSDSRHSQLLEPAGNLEQPVHVWWISPGKGAAFLHLLWERGALQCHSSAGKHGVVLPLTGHIYGTAVLQTPVATWYPRILIDTLIYGVLEYLQFVCLWGSLVVVSISETFHHLQRELVWCN